MNATIFQAINGIANTSKIIDFLGLFFADYLLYIIGIAFIVILFIKKTRLMAISIAVTTFLARIIIAEPIKRITHVDRPYVILDNVKKLISESGDHLSFPSGHATIVFAIATAIYFFNKKWGIVAFVVAILVGISRIYVGVHWPLDIVAGALIGILSGIIVNKFVIKRRA
ncbi:MAG: phosphatase PAP2 family protein [Candidatus Portnoybacteria bacterium]|nr:phosphatase PAP2 family protein [Candidatus Portnoybacteria bacterium]